MSKKRRRSATRQKPEPKKPLDLLSLIIAAVALTVLALFFFPWLDTDEYLSGLDVASRNLQVTENFPSGIVFILPLVVGSILFQYYRRVRDDVRPRRRFATISMLVVGLIATGLWIRAYTLNATDMLNALATGIPELPEDPAFPTDSVEVEPEPYTTGDILREQFTIELWLHLALAASLLVLPYLDPRPPADPPEY